MVIDEQGTFTYLNPKFTELFGYDLTDVPNGREWYKKLFPTSKNGKRQYRDGQEA